MKQIAIPMMIVLIICNAFRGNGVILPKCLDVPLADLVISQALIIALIQLISVGQRRLQDLQ